MRHAETESLKSLVTRRVDKARHAYAREMTEQPRRTVFIGTTNNDEYLRDASGNRRFVPVQVGQINMELLTALRLQLWGEASALEKAFGPLVLSADADSTAEQMRRDRIESNPWDDAVEEAASKSRKEITGQDGRTLWFVDTQSVLYHVRTVACGGASLPRDATQQVGRILARLGWENHRVMVDGRRRRGYAKSC